MHCILTFCDLLAPALAGLRVAEEDVGCGAVVVVVTRAGARFTRKKLIEKSLEICYTGKMKKLE